MDENNLRCKFCKEGSFFNSRVSTTNNCNNLIAEEETIAGSAPRYAASRESLLIFKPDLAIGRTHSKNYRLCFNNISRTIGDYFDFTLKFHLYNIIGNKFGAKALCLVTHALHEIWTHYAINKTRKVFDLSSVHKSATSCDRTFVDQWLKVGACSVNGGGIARGPGADNHYFADRVFCAHNPTLSRLYFLRRLRVLVAKSRRPAISPIFNRCEAIRKPTPLTEIMRRRRRLRIRSSAPSLSQCR